jgi:S1-C subfamily serine protease
MRASHVVVAMAWAAAGCGGQAAPQPQAPASAPAQAADAGKAMAPKGHLLRRDVMPVLSAGPAAFLSRIEVKPAFVGSKFHGWRIVALHWEGTPLAGAVLQPGDVVTSVNGRPIETPEQLHACFQLLTMASELRVVYERGTEKRDIVYPIDDEPPAAR